MKTISLGHCHRKYKIPMNTISSTSSSHFINKLKANHTNERIDPSIESAPQCSGNIVLSISPSLIYVQNPLTWLSNKFRLKLLRYTWDHDFVEREFKRGATQVLTVCNIISEDKNHWIVNVLYLSTHKHYNSSTPYKCSFQIMACSSL